MSMVLILGFHIPLCSFFSFFSKRSVQSRNLSIKKDIHVLLYFFSIHKKKTLLIHRKGIFI